MNIIDRLALPAELPSLARSRAFVAAACRRAGVGRDVQLALKLAVDEVLSNLMAHAGRGAGDDIELTFECEAGEARVTVRDQGPPFDPHEVPPVDVLAPLEQRSVGGLGWHLVRQMVDEVHYASEAGAGNRLVLVKRLGGSVARGIVTKEST